MRFHGVRVLSVHLLGAATEVTLLYAAAEKLTPDGGDGPPQAMYSEAIITSKSNIKNHIE